MLIDPLFFYSEVWKDITEEMVYNIMPNYMVSNFGRVKHKYKNTILEMSLEGHGYYKVHLQLKDKSWIRVIVSRLVAMAFCVPENYSITDMKNKGLQVNHSDGKKLNNYSTNLEWITAKENMIHSFENDLNHRGENMYKAILTNSQVHEICKLLESDQYSYPEINRILNLGLKDPTKYISEIKTGVKWKHISSQYNIKTERKNSRKKF